MRRILNQWTKSSVSDSYDIGKGGGGGGEREMRAEGSERVKRESF